MANANIKAVITAEDRASGALAKFGSNVDSLGNRVATGLKRATVAFGAAATAATGFAIKSAADFEQTRIGLENMLGSAEKARSLLNDLSNLAAETPFEFPELARATKQLVAFGFNAEEAFAGVKNLGDISAAIGADINDLAYLMGTLRAQGRAFTIDIRQFASRGVPIYEYLGKVLGKSTQELTKMVEAGKIGFPEVQKAFQLMTAEGGKFHGAMEKQSKSLSGLFSTLKDNIGFAARELVGITKEGEIKAGSPMESLKNSATALNASLPQLTERFREIAMSIANYLVPKFTALVNTIKQNAPTFQALAQVIGTVLVGALGLAIDALNLLLKVFGPVFNFMRNNSYIVSMLAGAFIGLKVAMMFSHAAAVFAGAMAIVRGQSIATAGTLGGTRRAALLMRAAIVTPMVMPAIAVGAALAALGAVIAKAIQTRNVIRSVNQNIANNNATVSSSVAALVARTRAPYDLGTQSRARQALRHMGISGYAEGGFTGIGGTNEPAGIVHKGEYVIPKKHVDQRTGMPKTGANINVTIQAGAFLGSEVEARKFAVKILDSLKDVAASKGTTLKGMMS